MWPTLNDPFCWFRFGPCGGTGAGSGSASDTIPMSPEEGSQAAAAASEACGCDCPDTTRDSWPFRAVLTGDFASAFNSDLLTHTLVAATVGALCASFFLYLSWRQRPRPPDDDDGSGSRRRRRDTGDSAWAADDHDPYLEGKYAQAKAKPGTQLRGASILDDLMSEPNFDKPKEAYAGVKKPEKQDPGLDARRFDEILRQDSHASSELGSSFHSYSDRDRDMPSKRQSTSSNRSQGQWSHPQRERDFPSAVTSATSPQFSVIGSTVSVGTQCSFVTISTTSSQGTMDPFDDQRQQQRTLPPTPPPPPTAVSLETHSAPSLHSIEIQDRNPFRLPPAPSSLSRPVGPHAPRPGLELHQYPRDTCAPCSDPSGMTLESTLRLFKTPYALVQDCSPISVNGPWLVFRRDCDPPTKPPHSRPPILRIDGKSERLIEFLHETFPGSRDTIASTQVEERKKVPMHFISTMVEFQLTPSLHRWRSFQETAEELSEPTDKLTCATHACAQTKMDLHRGLVSLSAALDTKPYFVGQSISTIDCRVFGTLCQMVWAKPRWCELQELIREFPNLIAYCHRVRSILWPDWDSQLKPSTSTRPSPTPTPTSAPLLGSSSVVPTPTTARSSRSRYKWTAATTATPTSNDIREGLRPQRTTERHFRPEEYFDPKEDHSEDEMKTQTQTQTRSNYWNGWAQTSTGTD